MTYVRKTCDEYEVQGHYGEQYGWECLTTEETWREARLRLREYHDNEPGPAHRIVKKRVRVCVTEAS